MGYNNDIYIFIYSKNYKIFIKIFNGFPVIYMKIILKMAQSKIIEFLFLKFNQVSMIL